MISWMVMVQMMCMMLKQIRYFVLAILLTVTAIAEAKVYLVSVGISDYPGTQNDLRLPVNDAKTITWLYSKNTSLTYQQLLNHEAQGERILKAIKSVFAQAKENDIVVLFLSGHGYPGGFVAYDGKLPYSRIRKAMASSKCPNKMIFADACFSGKMRTDNQTQSHLESAKKANVMLFLSSRSNETSIERRDMKNGFFTTYLQKGLRGGADANRDRVITAKELFKYVHEGVAKLSYNKQHPVMWGKFSDNMPVMKW